MKIVLRADVANLGNRGDVVTVSDGYGRNYLIANDLALKATPGAEQQAIAMRRTRELAEAKTLAEAQTVAARIAEKVIRIGANAGPEGQLFGSVTTADISTALGEQANVTIDRKDLTGDAIKSLGMHSVSARIHPEVSVAIQVEVVAV